jgi:molybdopterin-binding protein
MQLSARNQLMGTVVDVTKGQTTAHVRINVNGTRLMASITNEAVDELKCGRGGYRLAGNPALHPDQRA